MTLRTLCIRAVAAGLLLASACQNPDTGGPTGGGTIRTTVTGTVTRNDDSSPVPGAVVFDMLASARRDTTDSNGQFSIGYDLTSGQSYTSSLVAQFNPGFGNDTAAFSLTPGTDITVSLTLVADSTSPITGGTSGEPASIVLVGTDVTTISIRGSGVNESALLSFEVRDSLGNPVLGSSGPVVKFSIIGGPNGGEYVFPLTARVNGTTGRVATRLNSGTKPGVIQVQASARNDSVLSAPARLTIASGPPDGNNVSISRASKNVPGGIFDNERVRISVIMGDRYQNPVPAGTAVYFTTNGGLIQPTGYSDPDGTASVDLITANPRPPGGVAIVTARTIGDTSIRRSDSLIQRQIAVVFSGATVIIAPTVAFGIADSGSYSFAYEVQDANGNPLTGGTTIKMSLTGPAASSLQLQGDVDVTMEDTDDPAKTNFNASLVDNIRGGTQGIVTVNIEVKSRNGNATHQWSGLLLSTGGGGGGSIPGSTSTPHSITLSSVSTRTLSIRGTGSNETSRLVFVVRDSLGNPVGDPLDPTKKTYVTFSVNPVGGLGGGEYVYPTGDSTDFNGQVVASFNAGTKAGVVQIVASTFVTGVGNITASAVPITIQGGLPDSTRFIALLDKVNMPGLITPGQLGAVTVQVGDEFGNPAQQGTAVYFSTSIGMISPSGNVNEQGQTSAQLSGGVVGASNGQGVVTVQTVDKSGAAIRKYLPFLFTGASSITGAPASGFTIPDSGFYSFSFRVADLNGNPLSAQSRVSVTVGGPGSGDLELSGDVSKTFPDTRDTMETFFNVTATDKTSGGASGIVTVTITVTGSNGPALYTFTGTQLVAGQPGSGGTGTGFASSIVLASATPEPRIISVRGTGMNENAVLRFIVRDSSGVSVDLNHRATLNFSIQGGPGGGEFLTPSSAQTDASGQAYVTLNSGTKAGVLQIRASTTIGATTITSAPVVFTIVGGLPVLSGMTVWSDVVNMPGLVNSGGQVGNVFVQLGDKYGNPVQPNTAVYFSTNGGLVTGSAGLGTSFTSSSGQASGTVYGGAPYPAGGLDTVTVTTVDENNTSISKQLAVTFSGAPVITLLNAPTDTIVILDGGFFDLAYRIADANGNPLAGGNSVAVSVSSLNQVAGNIQFSGDNSFTTVDTRATSTTTRVVRVRDGVVNGGNGGEFKVTITVNGPNAMNGPVTKTLVGLLGAPGQVISPSPTQRLPAAISFIGVSASDLFVSGVGGLEQAVITYEVLDSSGTPLNAANKAYATFTKQFFPNNFTGGGSAPYLLKNADSTNEAGRLLIQVVSGTQAGVIQISVTIMVGATPITTSPVRITVHAGYPDQRHFTISPKQYNFPGLGSVSFVTQNITVQVADKYSNPVQQGTAVYFHSQHGTMGTGALTDATGFVSNTLFSANPFPRGVDSLAIGQGYSYVLAQTIGQGGTTIIDSVQLLWTGDPIIVRTSGPNPFTVPNGGSDGPWTFTVMDFLGHPMSSGTTISVSAGDGTVSGDADVTIPDTKVGGAGVTDFTILVSDADSGDPDPPKATLITVTVSHPVFGTFKRVIASGTVD